MEYVTQAEAARLVGVAAPTIMYWIKKGLLPAKKSGRILLIAMSDLEKANARSLQNIHRKVAMRKVAS